MNTRSKSGFTLVEIMIVILIIGLLTAIAIPGFMKSREQTRKQLCSENQRLIREMMILYCLDNRMAMSSANFADIGTVKDAISPVGGGPQECYLKNSTTFDCPSNSDGSENDYESVTENNMIIDFKCTILAEHNE
jgi:prepilin-type N-terminal cleavage/methylation domain-containing protein